MRNITATLCLVFIAFIGYAQTDNVGINTTTPNASLDIQAASPNTNDNLEGILIPRVSKAKAYNMANGTNSLDESTLIYINDTISTAFASGMAAEIAKVEAINENGFYFWNGAKWIKAVSSDGAIWGENDTLVYMKRALDQGDTISYKNNRYYTSNLGGVTIDDLLWEHDTIVEGYNPRKIPYTTLVSSDRLPAEGLGSGENFYFFSGDYFLLKQDHFDILNTSYPRHVGNETRLVVKDVTSPIDRVTALHASNDLFSNTTAKSLIGLSGLSTAGSANDDYNPTVNRQIGGDFIARNNANVSTQIALQARTENRGNSANLYGGLFNTSTQSASDDIIPTHTVESVRGIQNGITIAENATVNTNSVYGIENYVTVDSASTTNNVIGGINRILLKKGADMLSERRGYASYGEVRVQGDFSDNDFWGSRSTFDLNQDSAKARNVFLNESVMYSTGENSSLASSLHAFRFWNAGSDNWTANAAYGMSLDSIVNGTTSNYGIYLDNVGNNTAENNFAIYTKKGKVSLGDSLQLRNINDIASADASDKIVLADSTGVLSTKSAADLFADAGEWVTEINGGDTLTYLKDAITQGDTIMYSVKRGSYTNLGQGDPTENIWSDGVTVGTPINEIPLLNVISSDALPINSTIGNASNTYNFSSNLSILKNNHASANATNTVSKSYDGFQSKLLISNDVTETLGTITGATSSATNRATGTINAMYGGRNFVVNGVSGEPNTNVNFLTALNAVNINIGTTNEMTGVSAVINNRGTANKIFGANIITTTQSPQNGVIAAHSVDEVKGIRNALNITENATVTTNEAYGIENKVVVKSNTSLKNVTAGMNRLYIDPGVEMATDNRGFGSYSEVRIKDEFISNDFWGTRNTFNLETDNAKARNVLLNESVLYSSGENTSVTGSLFGYKFWNPNASNWTANSVYGMYIGSFNNGTSSNYGLYLGDIGNSTATNNYAIYTNAGKVYLQDSVGVGITSPDEKLHVDGNVKANTFIAASGSTFPDYVFEKYYQGESQLKADYEFRSLEEVEAYTKAKGHLPGYASAKEVAESGQIDMTATQLTNVEKIEELYLHTIEQQKKIDQQTKENESLKKELAELKQLVNSLIDKSNK